MNPAEDPELGLVEIKVPDDAIEAKDVLHTADTDCLIDTRYDKEPAKAAFDTATNRALEELEATICEGFCPSCIGRLQPVSEHLEEDDYEPLPGQHAAGFCSVCDVEWYAGQTDQHPRPWVSIVSLTPAFGGALRRLTMNTPNEIDYDDGTWDDD